MRAVDLAVRAENVLGEGILWDDRDGRVWWTDIQSNRLHAFDPITRETETIDAPERIACFAPRAKGKGLLVAFAGGFALWHPDSGEREDIAAFEPDLPTTRLNDGRTDRQGRLIAGGYDERGGGQLISSVVRVDPDLTVTTLFGGIGCANGTCFSPDGRTMYFADTMQAAIWAFAYDTASGTPSECREVCTFKGRRPGSPDGSCVDEEGCIWNAEWDGGAVVRWTPDGRLDRVVELPVPRPTCCAFGGPDLDTLYITTARLWMDDAALAKAPLSGSLFATKPGVRGVLDTPFAG